MLFARLQGEAVGGFAVAIHRNTDETARHGAFEAVARCHECRVRPAEAERHAEALRVADDDVGVPFAGRGEDGQREEVGRHYQHRAVGMGDFRETAVIGDVTVRVRILHQHAEVFRLRQFVFAIDDRDFNVLITGAGEKDVNRLRMHALIDEKYIGLCLALPPRQHHRFCRRRRFIKQRGVGDFHAGQIADHRLEIQQRFQTPLRNLRLVRRVRGVPRRILQHITQNHRRHHRAVIPLTNQRAEHLVLVGNLLQRGQRLALRKRRGQTHLLATNILRHHRINKIIQTAKTQKLQHLLLLGGRRTNMTGDKRRMSRHDKILNKKSEKAPLAWRYTKSQLLLGEIAVGGLIHQTIQLGNIGELHLVHPTLRFCGRIKQIWLIDQRLIDLNHLTGHRTFHLAGGLHRLNHRGLITDCDLTANLRQLDKNNIAQRILGKIRNPDSANRTLDTNPLMIISKLQHKNTS